MNPVHSIKLKRALLACVISLCGTASAQTQAQPKLDVVVLQAGMHNIHAELARTAQQRYTGLMFRREMAPHEGMLFVFEFPHRLCFHMGNTLLPLTIAFIADDGRIVDLADMRALSQDAPCATEPVRYALEMNQGWFAKRGIKPGFKLKGAPFSP